MNKLLKKLDVMWKDKRAELSNEVSHKEKRAVVAEMAKIEQINNLSIF